MAIVWQLTLFIVGLAILTLGAEGLVRGAARLARAMNISPLVIGLTIVAFGTSLPEMVVSVLAGLGGNDTIAMANVVGSNIANIALILGLSALVTPLTVDVRMVRREMPIMLGSAALLFLLALDQRISRLEGIFLFAGIVAFTLYSARGTGESAAVEAEFAEYVEDVASGRSARNGLMLLAGLVGLLVGAQIMVEAALTLARAAGISELVIGLTLVAVGTSLPELATSVVASYRGERDIAVGNVVGSNIFNVLAIIGVAAMVSPLSVGTAMLSFDFPIMLAASVALVAVVAIWRGLSRLVGGCFLGSYITYTLYLYLTAATPPG